MVMMTLTLNLASFPFHPLKVLYKQLWVDFILMATFSFYQTMLQD